MDSKIKKYCPNCSQPYRLHFLSKSQKSNLPLFLSCGHSMCEKCITNIIKFGEPIECKVCNHNTEIAASDVTLLMQNKFKIYKFFPINIYMIGELAVEVLENPEMAGNKSDDNHYIDLKMLIADENQERGECVECHKPTAKMCQQCDNILCDSCFNKSHKNFVMFKNHTLTIIEKPLEDISCKIHNKPLDYYCKDCKKVLCMDCFMVGNEKSCKNHNVVSMQEVNRDIIQELVDVSPKIDETFRRLTKSAVNVGNLLNNIESENATETELTKIVENTEQCFSKLLYQVQKHKKEIFDMMNNLKESEKNSLQKVKQDIEDYLRKVYNVRKMISMTSNSNKLNQMNLPQLLEKSKEAVETPWFLNKDFEDITNIKITVNEDLCTLLSDYVHFEGNSKSVYKLSSTSQLGDIEIPPPPKGLVYPPELPRDVRQLEKLKTCHYGNNKKEQSFYKSAPKYCTKSGSTASLSSNDSGEYNKNFSCSETRHRQTCLENQYATNLQEGTQELIYISHIIDPHNFYVQRACHQNVVKEMINEFRNAISMPKPSISSVSEGKMYLVFHKTDNMWQRCRVVNVDRRDVYKPLFTVLCLDFGSTEVVNIEKLRLIPPARAQFPPSLAFNCALANCLPKCGTWTNDDAFLIQNIIDNKQAIMHIRNICSTSNDNSVQIECDITTFEHGISIAHALVYHERAKMPDLRLPYIIPKGIGDKPKIFMSYDNFKPKSAETVYITHIVSPDSFFVRKTHHQKVYEKLCEDMYQQYSLSNRAGTVYLPEVGMVYAANVEKYRADMEKDAHAYAQQMITSSSLSWQRGVVREVLGRGCVRVYLPDTGELLILHYTALRHIHHNFITLNALATECHLACVTPLKKKWSAGSVALLYKFTNRLLELHVENNRNRGSLSVTLYDNSDPEDIICVNSEMIKHKFAITFGIFNFNRNKDAPDEMTMKMPNSRGEVPVPVKSKPKIKQNIILKRQTTLKKVNEDNKNLEAKDKGPLRLEAKILNYQSPSLIYLSLVDQHKTFTELSEEMQKYYLKSEPLSKNEWKVNDRCCALCIQSETWRRAIILELIDKKEAKVFYYDFACIETITLSSLRELTSSFKSLGDAAIQCHLCGVMPAIGEEWPSLTKEYLKELLDAYKRIFITKRGEFKEKSMPVEIWVYHTIQGGALEPNRSEWRCLNRKIIEQGLGIPDKSCNLDTGDNEMQSFLNLTGDWMALYANNQMQRLELEPTFDTDSNSSMINVEEFDNKDNMIADKPDASSNVVTVSEWLPAEPLTSKEFTGKPTHVNDDGIIYLHDMSQEDTLQLIIKALDVSCSNPDQKTKLTKWTVGEPCIALYCFDNKFYRAKILQVNEQSKTCIVHFIDYGSDDQCSFEDLRKSIALHQISIQATKCMLSHIRPKNNQWDTKTLNYLHELIVDKQCYVKVVGDPIGDVVPIELKYGKLWINDHLVELEKAVYCDESKNIERKFAPQNDNIECDSDPDFIVEEDPDSVSLISTTHEYLDLQTVEGKNWNQLMEEESESLESNYLIYPEYKSAEFSCDIEIINDPNCLQLKVQDINNEKEYNEIFKNIQKGAEEMAPLSDIFENKSCIAIFSDDKLWYRASILQYSQSKGKVKVIYVDFGNIDIIPLTDVKEINKEWITVPPLTISAKLYGVKLNDNADMNDVIKLYQDMLLVKGKFQAKVISYENSVPYVELRNENGELVNDSLIKTELFSSVIAVD